MKTLLIVNVGLQGRDKLTPAMEDRPGEYPRVTLFNRELRTDVLNEQFLETVPKIRRAIYRYVPGYIAQVAEAWFSRNRYDVVISWSELRSLLFGALLRITGSRTKHVAMLYWMSPPRKAKLLRFSQSHIDRIITWSSVQRDFAINHIGVPASKFAFVRHPVDQLFWTPVKRDTDMICSVGIEMRDYDTLFRAMEGLDIKCHVASRPVANNHSPAGPPPNVTVGFVPFLELRDLYARSRFVVVPLKKSDTDNGITTILEAMAMGKAVICSRTEGQVDVIQDGKTGFYVPQGDPLALRAKILELWNDPSLTDSIGKAGREYIERHHTLDRFVADVKNVVTEVMNGSEK